MEELVRMAQNGDEDAFNSLIINIESNLYKIARLRLSYDEDINDAVQETIIQVFKSIKKLKNPQYFNTWVVKILINKCNKIYRKCNKNEIIQYDEGLANNVESDNIEKNSNMNFFLMLEKLNYNERLALTLYYLERFTTNEISKILKEPESTIRNRLSRARNKLKNLIEGEDYNG